MKELSKIQKVVIFPLICVPILYLVYIVIRYSVDIPIYDEWFVVPLFEKMYTHTLTSKDLYAQFHEHRIIFPKIITLALGVLTGWNLKYEVVLNVFLGVGIFSAILYRLKKDQKYFNKCSIYLIMPSLSFLIFSLNQFENWLWGFQKCIFLNIISVVIGFILLSSLHLSWKSILLTTILGVIATYSFAAGLFFWPIVLVLIYMNPKVSKKLRSIFLKYWSFVSIIVFTSYFYGYSKPAYDPPISLTLAFYQPVQYVKYFFVLIGSPLEIVHRNWAALFGVSGLAIYVSILVKFFKAKLINLGLVLFAIASGLYTIINFIFIAAGRFGFAPQPVSRYVSIAELFWISIIILLCLNLNLTKRISLKVLLFTIFLIVLITILSINSSVQGSGALLRRYNFLSSNRNVLLSNIPEKDKIRNWGIIYPRHNVKGLKGVTNVTQFYKDINTLYRYNLSIFRD